MKRGEASGQAPDGATGSLARGVAAHIAALMENGSTLAAKACTADDAAALRRLGEDIATLAAAMEVLVRPSA